MAKNSLKRVSGGEGRSGRPVGAGVGESNYLSPSAFSCSTLVRKRRVLAMQRTSEVVCNWDIWP